MLEAYARAHVASAKATTPAHRWHRLPACGHYVGAQVAQASSLWTLCRRDHRLEAYATLFVMTFRFKKKQPTASNFQSAAGIAATAPATFTCPETPALISVHIRVN